ncbi:aminotransferase class III-fold pyridoxal phosphate-dependent enzyme [Microbacterium sp.]|uniref:aminotransferase class III-fold pyridoxal phosphate-dependent enzyme n=1 Tax=Microbacterium sp. TaxID=51671 RepID=UPI0039E70256
MSPAPSDPHPADAEEPTLTSDAPPEVDAAMAAQLLAEHYGLTGALTPLGSHQDINYRVDTGDERFLLKLANPTQSATDALTQSLAADHLARHSRVRVPQTRPSLGGDLVTLPVIAGQAMATRVLTFLEGKTWSGSDYLSPAVVRAFGTLAAEVDTALASFAPEHPLRTTEWDLRHAERALRELTPFIADDALRTRVEDAAAEALAVVAAIADDLPVQPIHGDLTDDNVLWTDPLTRLPEGVIDLGDLALTWTVGELAICFSSLLHHDGVSVVAALEAVTAYHRARPLSGAEVAAFWPLLVVRGAVLVASAHRVLTEDPANDYARENLTHELAILDAATSVPLAVGTALVQRAVGAVNMPSAEFTPGALAPLVEAAELQVAVLDLTADSDLVDDGRWQQPDLEGTLRAAALAAGAELVVVPFGAPRLTRSGEAGFAPPANVPLHLEVTPAASVTLRAPAGGEVIATPDGVVLRTAHADLVVRGAEPSRSVSPGAISQTAVSPAAVSPGAVSPAAVSPAAVSPGAPFATLPAGIPARIQLTAPHAAVPEWTTAETAPAWLTLCADPAGLVVPASRAARENRRFTQNRTQSPQTGLFSGDLLFSPTDADSPADAGSPTDAGPTTDAGTAADLLARRDRVLAAVQEHYYDDPPELVRGWRDLLIDRDGRPYLDAVNNVTSVGHAHPRLADAVHRQWQRLNTNSRFHYRAIVEFSEKLAATLHGERTGLDQVFLVNSGSEAVDLALRLARAATGRRDVLAMREAYHGWTDLSDAVSTSTADNPAALQTRPNWVHTVEAPNTYRGRLTGDAARGYADAAVAEIDRLAASGHPVGAFVAETYYGNAGGMALPDGYLARVYAAVRMHGGLAVADEVQVGYGRLGQWFWGFEQQGVTPDIVAVAKAMGNGHPLGAVITTRAIAEAYRGEGYFFSSAGGSPVSSVVGSTVLDIIRDERLQENAAEIGGHLKRRLEALADRHPLIGAVHGSGLYLGVELVRDRATKEPATAETAAICDRMRTLGVIIQRTGERQNILKLKPPLCLTRAHADLFVDALDRVLTTGW